MLQMVRYQTGEIRVIDSERMIASDWLHHSELDAPLIDYELGHDLADSDLKCGYEVLRDDSDTERRYRRQLRTKDQVRRKA